MQCGLEKKNTSYVSVSDGWLTPQWKEGGSEERKGRDGGRMKRECRGRGGGK